MINLLIIPYLLHQIAIMSTYLPDKLFNSELSSLDIKYMLLTYESIDNYIQYKSRLYTIFLHCVIGTFISKNHETFLKI